MEKLIDLIIGFLRKPLAGVATAILFLIASYLPSVPSSLADFLKALTGLVIGIVVNHIWQSRVIENERHEERIKVIEEFTELQRLGLKKILPERDSSEIEQKTYDFLERFKEFRPQHQLIIIGLTTSYLPINLADQISGFLKKNSNLKLLICVLDPNSPCASLRSQEVFKEKAKTQNNIMKAIKEWKQLKKGFPNQIILKKSKAIPYTEYEAKDIDKKEGLIYYTPIGYKAHTNNTPSFLFSPHSVLYNFHKKIIKNILRDAEEV